MSDDPLDAMKARWNHIQGYLFPWLREEVDPMTEALGRLVTTLDVIGSRPSFPNRPEAPAARLTIAAPSPGLSSPRRCWAFLPPPL